MTMPENRVDCAPSRVAATERRSPPFGRPNPRVIGPELDGMAAWRYAWRRERVIVPTPPGRGQYWVVSAGA